ncbi:uncharacterized protein B0I36DRAFT_152653 [Microdochium trichocladiopsis]|uniref:Cell wall biogenesis protein Mhp1 n=1 Tax=Microdochium trichocladiopsis TaxID=1682393 RepID=A0A9P9BJW4_9PEZI|nr:uncharacterized protein B0I36DRAFT_152653 [Microdochium trichocladiopsis]KAH7026004.1 hypothetical protein B0I36DRAFT_152653 [Microdochium trichocladiopsis]
MAAPVNMEQKTMDVSWMTHDKGALAKRNTAKPGSSPPANDAISPSGKPSTTTPKADANGKTPTSTTTPIPPPASADNNATTAPKTVPGKRAPVGTRTGPNEKLSSSAGTPPQRRGSWFSSMALKLSGSPGNAINANPSPTANGDGEDIAPLPKISPSKNAVLPHASRPNGDAPYVPAPPRSGQPGFLGVFRRLSSTNNVNNGNNRLGNGLVDRKILNVDKNRERCRVAELPQAKLRRVAFCVDVEIAPMPKYGDDSTGGTRQSGEKIQKKKIAEKGEGEALKNPDAVKEQKEGSGIVQATGEQLPKEPKEAAESDATVAPTTDNGIAVAGSDDSKSEKDTTRKKEKKKGKEAERKAKKEQKRREALEKGAIPMEIHLDSDSSNDDRLPAGTPRVQSTPTTNPARIYRRCCQLRETDILTKITLQLPKTTSKATDNIVDKLDLTGYFLSLQDLITLGDFLAIVPVREVILEGCGLADEGMRVVLAGLLAARRPRARRRKSVTVPADLSPQGGVVERLVLKNNKIGVEGWKHIFTFIHLCRSIKYLDLSNLTFPGPTEQAKPSPHHHLHFPHLSHQSPVPIDLATLFSRALGERLGGKDLELLNISSTGMNSEQLKVVIDGCIKSGLIRLGLANNHLDALAFEQVARYLREGRCEGLDIGGNDLRDHVDVMVAALDDSKTVWALSLANCNLHPPSMAKLFPALVSLPNFKFLDLSHNHDLFESEPSALGLLRRNLPKMHNLRRLHLADVSMSSEQAIALAEILPEASTLAHINLLDNPALEVLADAKTEANQEEACALYASLLAAARVSNTLIKIDIDAPSAASGEIVKALANQVLAHCLKNLQGVPEFADSAPTDSTETGAISFKYPDVLRDLVGQEEDDYPIIASVDGHPAADEDYVIGGTGVAKALACVLKNRGDDTRRPSGEFLREPETPRSPSRGRLPPGKAKNMSKHLLMAARKIQVRLQPALARAKAAASADVNNYNRLMFLNQTIMDIITRFEDEFPETKQYDAAELTASDPKPAAAPRIETSVPAEHDVISDTEDLETDVRTPSHSRSNSVMSSTHKAIAEEEGRMLRAGHHVRRGFLGPEHYEMFLTAVEQSVDPSHVTTISVLCDEIAEEDESFREILREKGPMRTFKEHREYILGKLRDKDPEYWERFIEAQEKAKANIKPDGASGGGGSAASSINHNATPAAEAAAAIREARGSIAMDEEAVSD